MDQDTVARLRERVESDRGKYEALANSTKQPFMLGFALNLVAECDGTLKIIDRCALLQNEPDEYPNGLVSPRAVLARQILDELAECRLIRADGVNPGPPIVKGST